jgi:hypothetical protein
MRELARKIQGSAQVNWTEEEWRANWRKFWNGKPGE